MTLMTST